MKTILSLAAGLVLAGSIGASLPASAAANLACSVPNNVVCTVTSATGLKSVRINANTGQGVVAVVNKSYRNCPRSVEIHWDSAYQMSSNQIVECAGVTGIKAN